MKQSDVVLCACGCGEPAPIAPFDRRDKGHVKGQALPCRQGHHLRGRRLITPDRYVVDPITQCWHWRLSVGKDGYGVARHTTAHRVSYEENVGSVAKGEEVDHLCCNRGCVNPAHLEVVTPKENQRRRHERAALRERAYDDLLRALQLKKELERETFAS